MMLLPEGGKILRVQHSERYPDSLQMIVEHPELPELKSGDTLTRIMPIYQKKWLTDDADEIPSVFLEDWGIQR